VVVVRSGYTRVMRFVLVLTFTMFATSVVAQQALSSGGNPSSWDPLRNRTLKQVSESTAPQIAFERHLATQSQRLALKPDSLPQA
jgi:hypothetical protein